MQGGTAVGGWTLCGERIGCIGTLQKDRTEKVYELGEVCNRAGQFAVKEAGSSQSGVQWKVDRTEASKGYRH